MASRSTPRLRDKETLDRDCLLDGFLTLYEECTHTNLLKIANVSSFVKKYNQAVNQTKKCRKKAFDFEVKALIGRGHFGEVRVVREKASDTVYAMKVLRKSDLLAQPEISCFEEERNIMATSTSPWITELHFAFQDSVNLYLVMDFHAGGDLLSLLSRHDDIFEEKMAQFYIAEIAIAINSLHNIGYLHRDIKPENILLDCTGHIKLADFGSAAKLDENKKVSSHMPVGTPDYVAPELLQAMNKSRQRITYGAEVDWWSLGVCAFEMLFGATPFSNEHATMVSTYANIMNFKNTLKFPAESDVSDQAKDFIKKLLTDSHSRLNWSGIKAHPFFKGVKWDTIRERDAIYVPSINGLDDTSHFDEVEKVQRQPDLEVLKPQNDFSGRDLPFVGFTFCKTSSISSPASPGDLNNSSARDQASLAYESTTSAFMFDKEVMKILAEKDQEINRLKKLVQSYESNPFPNDQRCSSLLETWTTMDNEIRLIEDELLEVKMEEFKAEIVLLQSEQEKLTAQLRDREYQLAQATEALTEAKSQLEVQKRKLEKAKRMSREENHKDLMLLSLNNETWESLLQDKQATIDEMSVKLAELEKLVEAYEESEEQQASEVQQLHHKMNSSLHDLSSVALADVQMSGGSGVAKFELDNFHHSLCPSKKKLTLHVTLKTGRCSFLDNQNVSKLQALQKMVDKYAENAREWREKEEGMNVKIAALESEVQTLKQKEGMGRKMKDKLMEKVSSYQHEVEAQKTIIKELQETMRSYLTQSATYTDSDKQLKEVQQSKLSLETELISLKEEVDKSRQSALHKTKQMEDAIKKLEEQRLLAQDYKNKFDCQVELTEAKVRSLEDELAKVTSDRQRLERREATLTTQVETLQGLLDDRTLELEKLERRNTDLQTHLQQLQQRNTDLQVQVESLQKASAQNDEHKQSKAELNFQISRLQQQNTDLERRITTALRDKQGLEDKVAAAEREKERLLRRIDRLETSEKEKRELETKLEKIATLERENRRLEMKVERLSAFEKDKLNLEEKLEKLEMNLRKEKIKVESLTAERKDLEQKLKSIQDQKVATTSEEIAQLKVKVALVDMAEKEKARLERELATVKADKDAVEQLRDKEKILMDKLKGEKAEAEKVKDKVLNEKSNLEKQKDLLAKEKNLAEKLLQELKNEKHSSDECVKKLNREIDRLESSLGKLQEQCKSSDDSDVNKLSLEIDRLKKLVDRLEKDKGGQEKRCSVELGGTLVSRLQRENTELRKQVESLEKQVGKSSPQRPFNRRTSLAMLQESGTLQKLRQEHEDKVKGLEKEITEMKLKLSRQQTESLAQDKNKTTAEEMKVKVKELEDVVTSLKNELRDKKNDAEELRSRLDVQTANVMELRTEIEELMKTENDLVTQLEKEALRAKQATEEKEKLAAQLKKYESQPARMSGELKFEKVQLESKVQELTGERDSLKAQLDSMKTGLGDDVNGLASQVQDLQQQLQEARREVEIRRGASEYSGGDIPAYLRHELEESNLALSEARSLLAASKRQELELRDRIDRLQHILDNKAVENARYLQNAQDALAELKTLKSQHDTLQRQYKVLEDKHASLQKERGSNNKETVSLMEEIKTKQQQYEMEFKKVEQLTKVCTELEDQVKDLEHLVEESKKREAEWESIKNTYEKAVVEREDELDGATQQLQAVSMARSAASEKMSSMKQQMESMRALHKAEIEKLNHSLREEKATVAKLTQKLSDALEKDSTSIQVYESQMKELDKSNQEKMKLKEELTQALSENCSFRKENLKLKKHLDDAIDKFEMIIGEKVSLENFTEVLQGLHFLDKYKFESTIGQQMKLIDYLQDLYLEHSGKKKKGLFGTKSSSKDGHPKPTLPISFSDLQTALEQERTKTGILQDKVDRLREENLQQANELLKLKQSGKVQANVTVKLTDAARNALANPPGSRSSEMMVTNSSTSLASSGSSSSSKSSHSRGKSPHTPRNQRRDLSIQQGSYKIPEAFPTPQRMHHNIPHRFATGLNTRTTKCGLCLGTVYFVRQASKCQECDLVVHPKCAVNVQATCGLPTEYVRHFALMMRYIYREDADQNSDVDTSCVKMSGWLKVPRVGKSGWENRYCVLEGTWLTLYLDEKDGNPVDSFDLSPVDADVSIHSAVTSAELANTATTDLHYVLRLDQDPLTTCWPGRYLYLMTTNFQEKQRWVASLEAVVKSAQCKSDLYRNRSQTLTVLSLKDVECRDFNCTLVISNQLVLVGTDDGLYAFNPQAMTSKRKQMTQLTGFGCVHQMALAKGVDLILVLTGPERRLIMLENKLVKCRMSQTLGGETTPFTFKTIDGLQCCTIFDVALWNNASYLVVGTPTKLFLMKYNPSLAMYCVRKEFPSSEPCSCVCIADNYAIVGTERFYKINLEHPSLLDFVDRQDSSLAFAAFGAANHQSYPLAVVRVSPENAPLEFLLCFHEFGVFVDHHGQRSRATDVKWSGLPMAFAYVEPFLYVTYTSTVHATVIPTDKARAKGRQTVIDIQSPRYLGPAPGHGCVYIGSSSTTSSTSCNVTEIISIRGQEDFSTEDSDKENTDVLKTPTKKHQFESPRKTPKFHQQYNKGSLASVYSNSSSSTYTSVESDV
ncbi:citron Rho-interacting kinase-like isoform X2 [Biomphalaria glabrata]|uniref:non-specific serine/threonine protein kinase n=1 Tax=Biomphalaria glabrata TaxID=6526 RepID=A0A9W2YG28_BIOGL|nr:citron Rho-interacting kinase-like isoform X2 [Biomphalaria glabrata]